MNRLFAGTPFDIPPSCDCCGKTETECVCTRDEKAAYEAEQAKLNSRVAPQKQTAKVSVQKRKGRRLVTVIAGLTSSANDLPELLRQLQSRSGTGGTVKAKEDLIELQGDHAQQVRQQLAEIGYRVR